MSTLFFNRPGRPAPIAGLVAEMRQSTRRLALASAWLTDADVTDAFIAAPAAAKIAIVNGLDLQRDRAARQLFGALDRWGAEHLTTVDAGLAVLGGRTPEGRATHMHHKFVVADDVVWFGSFNFTVQARSNYEVLVRVPQPAIAEQFWQEATALLTLARGGAPAPAPLPGYARCVRCADAVPAAEQVFALGLVYCGRCADLIAKRLPHAQEPQWQGLCECGCDDYGMWRCIDCERCTHMFLAPPQTGDGCGDAECPLREEHCAACHAWYRAPRAQYGSCPGCGGPLPVHAPGCQRGDRPRPECPRCQAGALCAACAAQVPAGLHEFLRARQRGAPYPVRVDVARSASRVVEGWAVELRGPYLRITAGWPAVELLPLEAVRAVERA
jgi:hypothetical protein